MGEALITRRGGAGGGVDVAKVTGGRLVGFWLDEENNGSWGSFVTVKVGDTITLTRSLNRLYGNYMGTAFKPKFGVFEFNAGSAGNRYAGTLYQYMPFIAEADKETVTEYHTEIDGNTYDFQILSYFDGGSVVAKVTLLASNKTSVGMYNGIGRGTYSMEYPGT